MSDEYPLYPELTEQGKIDAQRIMDSFKPRILKVVEELMSELYTDVSAYVETDHWSNYRNRMMEGFMGYGNGTTNHSYDFKELRHAIYKNNKEEIVKDLNQDLVAANSILQAEVERLRNPRC